MNPDCWRCDKPAVQHLDDGLGDGGTIPLCEKHATSAWHFERLHAELVGLWNVLKVGLPGALTVMSVGGMIVGGFALLLGHRYIAEVAIHTAWMSVLLLLGIAWLTRRERSSR